MKVIRKIIVPTGEIYVAKGDNGLITCGNAILSGTQIRTHYKVEHFGL